ncbi:hypothetical protein Taro_027593 [Colocasia esculenta]|uniref:Uncharacterized protein n=1 Tax=Colocasia esculenta TaxID=4460 RepID=A0A843VUR2_COLES|nr:hypothetical protein [Colocasia esculenta]
MVITMCLVCSSKVCLVCSSKDIKVGQGPSPPIGFQSEGRPS